MTITLTSPAWYTLPTHLDSQVVDVLRKRLAEETGVTRLILDAGKVRQLDPVGALRLWHVCRQFASDSGATVELHHLPGALAGRLRRHPLLGLVGHDDSLFVDPLEGPHPSAR
jgi:hypothetical protein